MTQDETGLNLITLGKDLEQRIGTGDREAIDMCITTAFDSITKADKAALVDDIKKKIAGGDKQLEQDVALMGARSLQVLGKEINETHNEVKKIFEEAVMHTAEVSHLEKRAEVAKDEMRRINEVLADLQALKRMLNGEPETK